MRRSGVRIVLAAVVASTALLLSGCSLASAVGHKLFDDGGSSSGSGLGSDSDSGSDSGDVFSIKVGDCMNDLDATTGDGDFVTDVPIVRCSIEHDSEVFASLTADDSAFPGEDAIQDEGDGKCAPPFEKFVGAAIDETALEYSFFYPSQDSWDDGDREFLCFAYSDDGQVSGTLRGKGPSYPADGTTSTALESESGQEQARADSAMSLS